MFAAEGPEGMAGCWRRSLAGSLVALIMGPASLPAEEDTSISAPSSASESQEPKTENATPAQPTTQPQGKRVWIRSDARFAVKTEEASAEFACFTKEQKAAFAVLLKERAARTKVFKEEKKGDPAEGVRINKWYNEELKKLISARQYELYVEYWNGAKAPQARIMNTRWVQTEEKVKGNETKKDAAPSTPGESKGPNFGSMEDRILEQLELSQTQQQEVAKAREELARENRNYREIVNQGDANGIAKKAGDINHLARSSMQKIMTKSQYAQYVSLWDEALGIKKGTGNGKVAAPISPAAKIEK